MTERGARNLILLSRPGIRSEHAISLIKDLNSLGVRVSTPACDVAIVDSLSAALTEASETMPPIKGFIQASMVLGVRLS